MHRCSATFNNISVIAWRWSVLLVEETGCGIGYTSTWTGFEITTVLVIGIDFTGSCKSNYNTITTTAAPIHVYTDSTCRYKFDYTHLTIVDMTLILLLDDTTSDRQWLWYTRYVMTLIFLLDDRQWLWYTRYVILYLKVVRPIFLYIPSIYGPQTLLPTLPDHPSSPPVFNKVRVDL